MTEEEMQHFNENYITRKQFIEAAKELWKPFVKLSTAWHELSSEDNIQTSNEYPFSGDFDEWMFSYAEWINALEQNFIPKIEHFKPTVTVKDMKHILSVLDDDTQIVISDKDHNWWINVKEVEFPSEGIFTLVLHPTNDFESTQF